MVMNPEVSPLRHKFFIVQASHTALFYVISWHIVWVWCVLMMDRQEGDCPCWYKGSHSVCRPGGDRNLDALQGRREAGCLLSSSENDIAGSCSFTFSPPFSLSLSSPLSLTKQFALSVAKSAYGPKAVLASIQMSNFMKTTNHIIILSNL